jgi:rhamnosyltransferase
MFRPMSSPEAPVTVFLPTCNAGPRLEDVLRAIETQNTARRVILRATDSSSSDGTRDVLARHGAELRVIEQRAFDHGRTRREAVLSSSTEFVVMLTQDARPSDADWLEQLLAPFEDPRVAGAWSRQEPRPDCHPFQRANLALHAGSAAQRVIEPVSLATWRGMQPQQRCELLAFDDVSSAVRRSAVERTPIPDAVFGEDMAWARATLLAGHRLAYSARSVVEHSHDLTLAELASRTRQTYAARRWLCDLDPYPTEQAAHDAVKGTTRFYRRAALRTAGASLPARIAAYFDAPRFARTQIEAARAGARSRSYVPPDS